MSVSRHHQGGLILMIFRHFFGQAWITHSYPTFYTPEYLSYRPIAELTCNFLFFNVKLSVTSISSFTNKTINTKYLKVI